tara:strand:+ start:1668 stop:1835 length:168 start_codon:yes stop_codon:yes gene_type:complete
MEYIGNYWVSPYRRLIGFYLGMAISSEMATSIGESIGNDIIAENKVVVISRYMSS